MKIMTKEWVKDSDFLDLIVMLTPNTKIKRPLVFLNGGTENIAKDNLHTVKTNLNVTDKENEIQFVMAPDTYGLDLEYLSDCEDMDEKTCKNEFQLLYLNRLRVISYLPEQILKKVKDKRLLALGYAEKQVKKEILKYIKPKYEVAYAISCKSNNASVEVSKGLTIYEEFKTNRFAHRITILFDGVVIKKVEKVNDEIHLSLDDFNYVVFSGAEITEQEVDLINTRVSEIELYKNEDGYELQFLLEKRDENFIADYYYATIAFKDLKFKN